VTNSQANHKQLQHASRAHWWILGAIVLIAAIMLPLSWSVIQAELAQGRNMKSMQAALKKLEQQPCDESLVRTQGSALQDAIAQIPEAFPLLYQ
jgi:hypothetical protein